MQLSLLVAVLAIVDTALSLAERWVSATVGEGLIFDMRSMVFRHVQRMPLAFFTRTQTGALITRLNNDVLGAQQAFTDTLSNVVSNFISVVHRARGDVLPVVADHAGRAHHCCRSSCCRPAGSVASCRRSPARLRLNAEMNTTMTERFNVSGALLVKLFGRPADQAALRGTGGPGARHRHHVGDVQPGVLRLADAHRLARHGHRATAGAALWPSTAR